MPYTKEQQQEYYLKRKAELNQKRAVRRKLARLGHSEVETLNRVETIPTLSTGLRHVETAQPNNRVETSKKVETIQPVSQPSEKVETAKKSQPVQILPQANGTTKITFPNLQACLDWINQH